MDLMYPIMTQDARNAFCPSAPWWTAPVIVEGSGGSGTRGSALLLSRLGVGMTCEDSILDPNVISERKHCNDAHDFDFIKKSAARAGRAPSLVWIVGGANTSSCAVTDAQCSSLLFSHAERFDQFTASRVASVSTESALGHEEPTIHLHAQVACPFVPVHGIRAHRSWR